MYQHLNKADLYTGPKWTESHWILWKNIEYLNFKGVCRVTMNFRYWCRVLVKNSFDYQL